jgi:hypothetical protein
MMRKRIVKMLMRSTGANKGSTGPFPLSKLRSFNVFFLIWI